MVFSFSFSYFETLDWTYLHFHLPSLLCPSCPEISVQLCGVVCWIILALSFVTAKQLSPLRGTWHSRHLALVDVFFSPKFPVISVLFLVFSLCFILTEGTSELNCRALNFQLTICPLPFSFLWTKVVFLVLLSNFFFASFCSFLALAFLTLFL